MPGQGVLQATGSHRGRCPLEWGQRKREQFWVRAGGALQRAGTGESPLSVFPPGLLGRVGVSPCPKWSHLGRQSGLPGLALSLHTCAERLHLLCLAAARSPVHRPQEGARRPGDLAEGVAVLSPVLSAAAGPPGVTAEQSAGALAVSHFRGGLRSAVP